MSFPLARNVYELLRGASRTQSLERLKKEGHRNVPVLRFSDVEALISAAVDDTLSTLALQLSESTVTGLTDEARARFLALVRERDELRATLKSLEEQQFRLSAHQETVRAEIQRAETELEDSRAAPTAAGDAELAALRERLAGRLSALFSAETGTDPEVAARALALVDEAVDEARLLMADRARRDQSAHVEQLQRRIARLRRKLEESELLLARARSARPADALPDFDAGQALAPGDQGYEQKRALLEEIFNLNVELKRMIAGEADTGTGPAGGAPAAP